MKRSSRKWKKKNKSGRSVRSARGGREDGAAGCTLTETISTRKIPTLLERGRRTEDTQ